MKHMVLLSQLTVRLHDIRKKKYVYSKTSYLRIHMIVCYGLQNYLQASVYVTTVYIVFTVYSKAI